MLPQKQKRGASESPSHRPARQRGRHRHRHRHRHPWLRRRRLQRRALAGRLPGLQLLAPRDCLVWSMYMAEGHCWHMMAYITLVDVQVNEPRMVWLMYTSGTYQFDEI
ncbi:unnamed protein product [Natator depressus]